MLILSFLAFYACSNKEKDFQNYLKQAKTFLEKNELDKARIQLLNAIKINSKNSDAYYYLGEVSLKKRGNKGSCK